MSKKRITQFLLTIMFVVAGIYYNGFFGGMITGISLTLFFLSTIGYYVAGKAAERIDKRITDIQNQILQHEDNIAEDGKQQ